MIFDRILPEVEDIFNEFRCKIDPLEWLVINRDLNGRVRLIVPEVIENDETLRQGVLEMASTIEDRLGLHAYPADMGILYEECRDFVCRGGSTYQIDGFDNVWLVDRLMTEGSWTHVEEQTKGAPRIVFFSIKGGVGRSSALAATAWKLAEEGKRVLVVDLDLESPGLSTALLPDDRQPQFGIADWMVEDLVGNSGEIFEDMIATSELSHNGEIFVVPAHGVEFGEYVSKLGRVWMPKIMSDGRREAWSARLRRLLQELEKKIQPDVILLDSRSGIDDVASACVVDIGATLVLLFAVEGGQTWNGYRMLFDQWRRAGNKVAETIRKRLQVVGALVPESNCDEYFCDLRDHSYELFVATLYDEIEPLPSGEVGMVSEGEEKQWKVEKIAEGWSFDKADEAAPHYPWRVKWDRSWIGRRSLHGRSDAVDDSAVEFVFGELVEGVRSVVEPKG